MRPAYTRTGHSMSLLELTQFCGLAGKLSRTHGAGRPALMSRVYHARLSQDPELPSLSVQLTDEEREDVATWKPPVDVVLSNTVLRYEDSAKEQWVALGIFGEAMVPEHGITVLTVGRLDFAWIVTHKDGRKWAYVADLKRSKWTPSAFCDSLQLHAYGRAYALLHECAGYCTGIWCALEGEWKWSADMVDLDTVTASDLWERIYYAATHTSDVGSLGDHCHDCFSRAHCPEYLMPAACASTWLAPVCEGVVPTAEQAVHALALIEQTEHACELAKQQLRAMVTAGVLEIYRKDGAEIWTGITQKGRRRLNETALREDLGNDVVDRFMVEGKPYQRFQWVKVARRK